MRNFLGKVKRGVKKAMSKINDAINQNVDNQLKKVDKVVEIMTNKEMEKKISILCVGIGFVGIGLYLDSIGKL